MHVGVRSAVEGNLSGSATPSWDALNSASGHGLLAIFAVGNVTESNKLPDDLAIYNRLSAGHTKDQGSSRGGIEYRVREWQCWGQVSEVSL